MRAVKILGRIFQYALLAVLSLLLLSNLWLMGAKAIAGEEDPTVFGYSWAVVLSGSMEPEIQVNDLVVSRRQESYGPGDVITFESGSSLVTHRIVEETEDGFITKGDANNAADSAVVREEQIVGKVILAVPCVGLVLGYMKTPPGMLCTVLIGLLLLVLPDLIGKAKYSGDQSGRM